MFKFGEPTIEKKSTEEINRVAQMAKICLDRPEFKEYALRYKKLELDIIDGLIADASNFSVSQGDLQKFGASCLVRLNRLRDVRSLAVNVMVDGKRESKDA